MERFFRRTIYNRKKLTFLNLFSSSKYEQKRTTFFGKFGAFGQLRGNQKDFNFQLHHRLSKFEVPVVVNLKHIFELFGLYTAFFLIQKLLKLIRLSSDGQFWRKRQKVGKFELRSQLCYYNCNCASIYLKSLQIYFRFCANNCNKLKVLVKA